MPKLSRFARPLFLSATAATFVAIVIIGTPVLLPFLLAIIVAYVLFPAVRFLERTRMPRWTAILVVYAITVGTVTAFGWATIPRFLAETKQLSAELPKLLQRGRDEWLPAVDAKLAQWSGIDVGAPPAAPPSAQPSTPSTTEPAAEPSSDDETTPEPDEPAILITPRADGAFEVTVREDLQFVQNRDGSWSLRQSEPQRARFSSAQAVQDAFDRAMAYAQHNSGELFKLARGVVAGLSRGIFYLFITLMLAGYMMYTYERIVKVVRELWPKQRRPSFDRFLLRVDRGLAGVVRGQLLICLVNGVLSAIGFWLFDLKYWPILALIAAVMSIIPIFGSILSSIPAVAIGLTQGLGTAVGVLVWIVGIHQLEANFLNPKIIGDAAKIHPVLVVFALLVGEHFFQIPGALLAVPCLALVQAVFVHFRESILGIPGPYLGKETAGATAGPGPASGPAAEPVGEPMTVSGTARAGPSEVGMARATTHAGDSTTAPPPKAWRQRRDSSGDELQTLEVRYSLEDPPRAEEEEDEATGLADTSSDDETSRSADTPAEPDERASSPSDEPEDLASEPPASNEPHRAG